MAFNSLTIFERATLANQFRILSFLDAASSERHLVDAEIFENGYTGLYGEALQHISATEISRETCTETHDILSMYRVITAATSRLSPAETAALDLYSIRFDGFDANHDDHYHFAVFMIEKQDKYTEHSAHEINSHSMASIRRYRRMLPVFKSFTDNHVYNLGVNELQQLIEAVEN